MQLWPCSRLPPWPAAKTRCAAYPFNWPKNHLLRTSRLFFLKSFVKTQRSAENLAAKLVEVNEANKLVRKVPTATQVTDWVAQAKTLPRVQIY